MKFSFKEIYNMNKQSAAMLTPLAQQAAMGPMPPPQGAPMDPAMAGGMPPQGAPMDPAMAGGMPPQGAPMDPAMAGGMPPPQGAPMDPAMAGGMPPQGAQGGGEWMMDQMFIDFLMQMGFQIDPQSGTVIDPNGQPMAPLLVDQLYAEFQAQVAQMSQGGAPMDPAMTGGMPPQGAPMDPSMMGGAPMDPAMAGGMPPLGMPQELMPPELMGIPLEALNQIASVVQDIIEPTLELKLATVDKKITAFNLKLDTIKSLLDDILVGSSDLKSKALDRKVSAELLEDLKRSQLPTTELVQPTVSYMQQPTQPDMLSLMRG